MKSEHNFILELENRALEQKKLVKTELIPNWAKGLGGWLAINPWRVLVPLAIITYAAMRILIGPNYMQFTLAIFGGY